MTITPTDEDITDAMIALGYPGCLSSDIRLREGDIADRIFIMAQTIAKLRVSVEALEVIETGKVISTWTARDALTQIKGTDHD